MNSEAPDSPLVQIFLRIDQSKSGNPDEYEEPRPFTDQPCLPCSDHSRANHLKEHGPVSILL